MQYIPTNDDSLIPIKNHLILPSSEPTLENNTTETSATKNKTNQEMLAKNYFDGYISTM